MTTPITTPSDGGGAASVFAAVDIGASGGRVMAATWVGGRIELEAVYRFPNGAAASDGHLRWDLTGLFEQVLVGLTELARRHPGVVSIGIDTWAVDYGLLDRDGRLLAEPVSYRDDRTAAVLDRIHDRVSPDELYAVNGLQRLPFTTIYQLAAEQQGVWWPQVAHVVLLPDLLGYWLTGQLRTEVTNASTTGLLDARSRSWSPALLDQLGLPAGLFPDLISPGERLGPVTDTVAARTGLPVGTPVVAVGSHDTASAVVGVPARNRAFAYVSSGTWSLAGVEVDEPVITEASRAANFTNEGGVGRRVRFLRNVGGLWLLQESMRSWAETMSPPARGSATEGTATGGTETEGTTGGTTTEGLMSLASLLAAAAALAGGGPVIDVDDVQFIAPGDMPARIAAACTASGQPAPDGKAGVVRCILDSLAVAYARTVRRASELSGHRLEVVHIVGGGSNNQLLCQLTADLSGLPVAAGPAEATAFGNVLVQARAAGILHGDVDALRTALRSTTASRRYLPRPTSEPSAGAGTSLVSSSSKDMP